MSPRAVAAAIVATSTAGPAGRRARRQSPRFPPGAIRRPARHRVPAGPWTRPGARPDRAGTCASEAPCLLARSSDSSRFMAADFIISLFLRLRAEYRPSPRTRSMGQACKITCLSTQPPVGLPTDTRTPPRLASPHGGRARPPQLPHRLVRGARLHDRHVDAAVRAELAGLQLTSRISIWGSTRSSGSCRSCC